MQKEESAARETFTCQVSLGQPAALDDTITSPLQTRHITKTKTFGLALSAAETENTSNTPNSETKRVFSSCPWHWKLSVDHPEQVWKILKRNGPTRRQLMLSAC